VSKKKIVSSVSKTISVNSVNLKDLEYIESSLKDDLKADGYYVKHGEYEYDSLESVLKDKPVVGQIEFKTRTPYLSVDIDKTGIRFFSFESSFQITGLVNTLYDYFIKKKSKLNKIGDFVDKIFPFVGGALLISPVLFRALGYLELPETVTYTALVVLILVSTFIWSARRRTKVFFTSEPPNFFARNQDKIILAIFVAVFTLILEKIINPQG